jgi:hypothetical protein
VHTNDGDVGTPIEVAILAVFGPLVALGTTNLVRRFGIDEPEGTDGARGSPAGAGDPPFRLYSDLDALLPLRAARSREP